MSGFETSYMLSAASTALQTRIVSQLHGKHSSTSSVCTYLTFSSMRSAIFKVSLSIPKSMTLTA
eukprot:7317-Heterococcus_DN1.PRE.6